MPPLPSLFKSVDAEGEAAAGSEMHLERSGGIHRQGLAAVVAATAVGIHTIAIEGGGVAAGGETKGSEVDCDIAGVTVGNAADIGEDNIGNILL